MKLPKPKRFRWNYLALAFAGPVLGMLTIMLIGQYSPFGNYSMLYSDMFHQYYPFFVSFRRALLSGKGLLYTWNIGMGMDYVGLISYYLASPLNWLSVLVPESWTLQLFSLLMPIKLGLASLFFAIFLKKTFQKNDLSITLFGCFYGLCAWALAYQWNIMWLDTFALLPLVALGTIALLRDKKFILYTVTLFLSIYSNYYIGLFTCFFVLILFIVYEICRFPGFKRFFLDLCRIALFSILAIGMTAIMELPTLAALQTTQSSVNNFPHGFRLNIASENTIIGLLDAMRQVAGNMSGGLEPSFKDGLPNLYCGVGTFVLTSLFLTAKDIKLKDKICSVVVLIFFMLSTIIRQLDYIWHGFHFTNMIPYRFTFLYSFVMLYMAYRAYLMRSSFRPAQVVVAALLAFIVPVCAGKWSDPVFLAYNVVFLLLYTGVLLYGAALTPKKMSKQKQEKFEKSEIARRKSATMAFSGILALELILNLVNFGVSFPCTAVSNYPKGTNYTASMTRYMQEREQGGQFYRAEVTHAQTLNDGALIGYDGISTFTSSANVRVTEFMQSLGYAAKNTYNRYCFEESSPVANLFLNLKYMLERDLTKENPYFDYVHHYGTVTLLENNAYLPLGFLANSQLANVDFHAAGNRFQLQNRLMTAASGVGDVWEKMAGNCLEITGSGATISNQSQTGYCSYETSGSAGTVVYTYTANSEGLMCIDLDLPKRNSYSVTVNGTQLYSETHSLPQMLSVSQVVPGTVVEIRLNCKANEKGNINIQAAVLNEEVFRSGYDVLAASTLDITTFKSTFVEGTIQCNRDGLLYTSIPQNGNWQVSVDGKPVDTVLIGDAMIGVPLAKGGHTVTFRYHNAAFSLGWKISLVCCAIFIGLAIWVYQPKFHRPGKFEKKES